MSGYYSIPLTGLKEGNHIFDYDVDGEFFEEFEESDVRECSLKASVTLTKRSAHMELNVDLKGSVIIMCDRCLEDYRQDIESNNGMLIKFGTDWEEVDDEVLTIPHGESRLDLNRLIYEFIHLALPIQRVHQTNEDGESECDPEMLKKLEEHTTDSEENIDPRWKDLGKLKDGLKNK